MQADSTKSAYWQGVRDGSPFLLVVVPFSLLFGVLASDAGLSVGDALGFSVTVIAGAAQFTALQLMIEGVPLAVVLASALAVNLRMAMYSATLAPHLGPAPLWQRAMVAYLIVDQSFALSATRYEAKPDEAVSAKIAYFFGTATLVIPLWYGFTVVGAMLGASIPDWMALDFALPITFIAMIAPALRTLAHVAAAVTSIILALLFAGVPFNLGLLLAAIVAMVVGARVEVYLEGRSQ